MLSHSRCTILDKGLHRAIHVIYERAGSDNEVSGLISYCEAVAREATSDFEQTRQKRDIESESKFHRFLLFSQCPNNYGGKRVKIKN